MWLPLPIDIRPQCHQFLAAPDINASQRDSNSSIELFGGFLACIGSLDELEAQLHHGFLCLFGLSANSFFFDLRRCKIAQPSESRAAPTLRPRPRPPRSLPSSSSASVVSPRRPTWPRLAVSSQLGMLFLESKVETSRVGIFMATTSPRQHTRANTGIITTPIDLTDRHENPRRELGLIDNWDCKTDFWCSIVMVSPVCTVWPTSRPRSWSSMSSQHYPGFDGPRLTKPLGSLPASRECA